MRVDMFNKTKLGMAAATSAVLLGGQVQAQDTREVTALRGDDFQLEEILVTARKKVENLQSVPIAIDAFSEQMLDEKAITTLEDVAKYSSSLTFDQGVLPNDTRPVIRGVNITRGRPNVGILIDGIDVSSETLTVAGGGAFANLSLLDLERVEVIKGPQSVTYGRSAFAGAVNYVTKRPVADKGVYGYVEAEYDEHEYGKILGNVSFPIIEDQLAAGITLLSSDYDGYYENPNTGGDLGGLEQTGAAIALSFQGSNNFSAYFRAEYADEDYDARPVVMNGSLSNVSEPGDFFLLGSLGKDARNLPIPGGARGFPTPTQEECDAGTPFSYLAGFPRPPACASMLQGAAGDVEEKDIDLSPNPNTGKDFQGTKIENTRLSLELDWQLGDIQLVSLSGYTDNDTSVEEDFDLTNFELESLGPGSARFTPFYIGPPDAAQTQFGINTNSDTSFEYQQISQELRVTGVIGDLEWMADALYWNEDMDAVMNQQWWARESMDTDYWNSVLSATILAPICSTPGDVTTCTGFTGVQEEMTPLPIPLERETDHWSLAASLVYNFTDSLRATAEGRYVDETIDYTGLPISVYLNGFLNIPYIDPETGNTTPQKQKEKVDEQEFVPRFSVDWQVTDDVFTYASVGKGFKPGGIATTDGDGDIRTGHYKPETLWAYEIGVKTDMLGNRLRLNGAVFYNEYSDQQVPFFIERELGVTNVSITNAGESEIVGFELEATYRPSENWTFFLGYTHVDTEYEDFNISDVADPSTYDKVQSGNEEGDFSGKSFPNTPDDVAVASIRYDGQFSNGMNYFTELFGNYSSKRYLDQGNTAYLDEVTILDFSAGFTSENWQLTAYVNNLTDEDKVQSGLGNVSYGFFSSGQALPFGSNLTLPQPRTFGMRARYKF
jgi:outer membrane receptor protein involved in Fe transport